MNIIKEPGHQIESRPDWIAAVLELIPDAKEVDTRYRDAGGAVRFEFANGGQAEWEWRVTSPAQVLVDAITQTWVASWMTPRQRIALEYTCKLPEETVHPRFFRRNGPVSSALTLNSGFEWLESFEGVPVWHASVALLDPLGRPIPLDVWGVGDLSTARVHAKRLLKHVGEGNDIWEPGVTAMHLRRRCHPREMAHQATDER